MNELRENNQVTVVGEVVSTIDYDHEAYGERFYTLMLSIERTSGTKDVIPVVISEHLLDFSRDYQGEYLEIKGEFRSFNQHDKTLKVRLYIFALEAELQEGDIIFPKNNSIVLRGTLFKEPVYRKTPFGRDIADVFIAVNRPFGRSDYIPCITWGRNAKMAEKLHTGDRVILTGRIQSREYKKTLPDGTIEMRTAYEVSAEMLRREQ
ncbi:MAG: single-stranded DNA-binding protein [Lachnospiraceae bacterium]|nr:single-stranded DNA-binding protein [Lachnospiraceae bacterium]